MQRSAVGRLRVWPISRCGRFTARNEIRCARSGVRRPETSTPSSWTGLVGDGFVILGGPVGDGEQTLHLVRAADEDEIRARLAADLRASA